MNPHTNSKPFKIINSKGITDLNEKLTIQKKIAGTSLAVQCLRINTCTAGGRGLIAGQGLGFYMPYAIGKKI
jgi:hypothetical protein